MAKAKKDNKPLYAVERTNRAVVTIRMNAKDYPGKGWEQWFLLSSDHHWDNPHCRRDLLKRHFDEAVNRNAGIFIFGDLFCAMQGRWDKRSDKSDIRPEHQQGDYLDTLVNTGADWYGNYADNIVAITPGNHESSIYKRHETDIITRLVERINTIRGSSIQRGGYSGWVRFMVVNGDKRHRGSKKLAWHHGYGGDAPVTKGTIQTNRMAVYLPDADIVVTGHTHNKWIFPISRLRLSDAGVTYIDEQTHVKIPGYKEEYVDGFSGWHVERGAPPKPTGSAWLRLFLYSNVLFCEVHQVGDHYSAPPA